MIVSLPKILAVLSVCLLFLCKGYAYEVEPLLINYKDGLPSQEVYDLYQDKLGRIWIASDRGLAFFNGSTVKLVESDVFNGEVSVFTIKEGNDSLIWVSSSENQLYSLNPLSEKHEFTPYEYNEVLKTWMDKFTWKNYIYDFTFDSEKNLFVSFLYEARLKIDNKGRASLASVIDYVVGDKSYDLLIYDDGIHPYSMRDTTRKDKKIYVVNDSGQWILAGNTEHKVKQFEGVTHSEKYGSKTYLSFSRYLIVKDKGIKSKELGVEILDFSAFEEGIVVATLRGIYFLDRELRIRAHFLKEISISSVLEDEDGGFWFSTLGKGIYYAPNIYAGKIIGSEDYFPTKLHFINGGLICSDNNIRTVIYGENEFFELGKIIRLGDLYRNLEDYKGKPEVLQKYLGRPSKDDNYDIDNYSVSDREIQIHGYGKNIRVLKNQSTFTMRVDTLPIILNSCQVSDSTALLGTEKGVFEFLMPNKITSSKKFNFLVDKRVNQITDAKHGYIIRLEDKLVYYSNDNDVQYYGYEEGLKNKFLNGVYKENDSVLWAYGDDGIDRLYFEDNCLKSKTYKEFDILPNQDVTAFTSNAEKYFVGSSSGVIEIDKSSLTRELKIDARRFFIDSIQSGNESLQLGDTIYLKTENKGLNVYFHYTDYYEKEIKLQYSFGQETNWQSANKLSLDIPSITYGEYPLKLRLVLDRQKVIVGDYLVIVPTPIYRRIWFLPSLVLVFGVLFFLLFRARQKRNHRTKTEKLKLEMNLLLTRMNPHFTFNTISSIQAYILNNEKGQAINYLSDFGLLMRKILDYSYKEEIKLAEEIEFLELWVALENKRFQSDFKLKFDIEKGLEELNIPPLLLQPIVENSIEHGVYNEGDEKYILIKVLSQKDMVLVSVEDNGIIDNSKKIKTHKSRGVSIIQERLKIHNESGKIEGEDYKVEKEFNPGKRGYRVILKLKKK